MITLNGALNLSLNSVQNATVLGHIEEVSMQEEETQEMFNFAVNSYSKKKNDLHLNQVVWGLRVYKEICHLWIEEVWMFYLEFHEVFLVQPLFIPAALFQTVFQCDLQAVWENFVSPELANQLKTSTY